MIKVSVSEDDIDVESLEGSIDQIMCELGEACIEVMDMLSYENVQHDFQADFRYGLLCRKLVDFLEESLKV